MPIVKASRYRPKRLKRSIQAARSANELTTLRIAKPLPPSQLKLVSFYLQETHLIASFTKADPNLKKVALVFGTRPEAIKMAPIYLGMRTSDEFEPMVIVTGQHRRMLDQILNDFGIRADVDLDLMRPSQELAGLTEAIIRQTSLALRESIPDAVLVHGDTTTAVATSVSAFYLGIPLGHVEAGLRTGNLASPFPEEFNRQVIARSARWNFAPTTRAKENLLREGINPRSIIVTGNTVVDALRLMLSQIESNKALRESLLSRLDASLWPNWHESNYVLVTGHRRENQGPAFENICQALRHISEMFPETPIIYPVHLNPKVRAPATELLGRAPGIHLVEPLNYQEFVMLLKHCRLVLTDSGGIQEEAPSLGKPVLVMRDATERPEAVESGTAVLVGTDSKRIVRGVSRILRDPETYARMSAAHNPYGDGRATEKILDSLRQP